MSEPAILSKEGDISTITLDDGKVNVFSLEMLESIQNCLEEEEKAFFQQDLISKHFKVEMRKRHKK